MNKRMFWITNIILIGCALVWTVTNVSYDEQYQMAMSYRLLAGDKMLVQMWEPHQTSAFICALFMGLYHAITGTYTGVAVFLHAVGMVIRATVAVCFYRTVKKDVNDTVAYFAAVLVFMISPKDLAMPEFANIQVWMAVLLFCSMVEFFRSRRKIMLIFAAICLCIQVLAYPSCLIVYIPAVLMLGKYTEKRERVLTIAIFTGVCVLIGTVYAGLFCVRLTPDVIRTNISAMMSLETSHTISVGTKLLAYLKDMGKLLLCYVAIGTVGGAVTAGVCSIRKSKAVVEVFLLSTAIVLLIGFGVNIATVTNRCAYIVIFIYLIITGLITVRLLSEAERRLYFVGLWIGVAGFVATLMLTDLPMEASGAYALPAIAVSVVPICKWVESRLGSRLKRAVYICGIGFVALLVVRCLYIRTPLTGRSQICSVIGTDMSLVRSGPLKGIITNDEGARKQKICVAEFSEYIPEGSKVWIVEELTDSSFYMLGDYEVAAPSTIADAKHVEGMKKYWELNPDKIPDVIVVACYGGEISYAIQTNSWIIDWIENEYEPSATIDGTFYRFIYK